MSFCSYVTLLRKIVQTYFIVSRRFSILKQMCLKPNKRAYGNGFTCQRFKNHTHLMQWGEFAAGPHLLSNCLANSMIESCQYLEFFNCCCQLCCEWFRGNYWCAKIHARVNFAIVNWNSTRWWLWKKICDSTGLMHILLKVVVAPFAVNISGWIFWVESL